MKVKCIVHEYFDINKNKYIKKDEIVEVNEKRAKILIARKLVEPVVENKKSKET